MIIYTGVLNLIHYNLICDIVFQLESKNKFKYYTHRYKPRKGQSFIIMTPFNKGELLKVHCKLGKGNKNVYYFYYGTIKWFYSTDLLPLLNYINNDKARSSKIKK